VIQRSLLRRAARRSGQGGCHLNEAFTTKREDEDPLVWQPPDRVDRLRGLTRDLSEMRSHNLLASHRTQDQQDGPRCTPQGATSQVMSSTNAFHPAPEPLVANPIWSVAPP